MDKNVFKEKFDSASAMSKEETMRIIVESIESNSVDGNPRGHRNLIIVMEELAELTQEISKSLRGKSDHLGIIEELADVQLGIFYVQEILKVSDYDLEKAMAVKMDRTDSVLHKLGQYK